MLLFRGRGRSRGSLGKGEVMSLQRCGAQGKKGQSIDEKEC